MLISNHKNEKQVPNKEIYPVQLINLPVELRENGTEGQK